MADLVEREGNAGEVRANLLAVEAELPDGELAHFGSAAVKDVAGLDLKRLVAGGQGMMGRVRAATLRVRTLWTTPVVASGVTGPGSTGSGCSRRLRTGRPRTKSTPDSATVAPKKMVGTTPMVLPSAPPTTDPTGMVPQTTVRTVAFIRPWTRSGVIAWRRLTWVML